MAPKLTRLTHKIAIQLHVVVEDCTIDGSDWATGWTTGVPFLSGVDISLRHRIQTGSGARPHLLSSGYLGHCFPGVNGRGVKLYPPTPSSAEVGAIPPLHHTSSWHGA